MHIRKLEVQIRFISPLLGSGSANPELHEEFIASKAKTDAERTEEMAAMNPKDKEEMVKEEIEKSRTVFARTPEGVLHLWDYQVKGFLKSAIWKLMHLGECPNVLTEYTYKKIVNGFLFVKPRVLGLRDLKGEWITKAENLQRPLQAETLQGPRVCLASSEVVGPGASMHCTIEWLQGEKAEEGFGVKKSKAIINEHLICGALDMGAYEGLGQWRGSGQHGQFEWSRV